MQTRNYIVIGPKGEYLGGVDNWDWSIYLGESGKWEKGDPIDGFDRVGRMILPHWVYERIGKGHRAPGFYYNWTGTYSISLGLQGSLEGVRISTPSLEVWSHTQSLNMDGDVYETYWIGDNNDEFRLLAGGQYGIGADYSIRFDSNLRPISGTQLFTFSVGPVFLRSDGTYGISIDCGLIGIFNITFTGSIFYGGN